MAENFIEKRKANWKRLEELLDHARTSRGLRSLSRDEVRELGRSYRRAATDLAVARVESRDQRLVNYLNNLVVRAHGLIYRSESKGARAILDFYLYDFPAIFRRTLGYTVAVFLIFIAIAITAFFATWRDDDFADFAELPQARGAWRKQVVAIRQTNPRYRSLCERFNLAGFENSLHEFSRGTRPDDVSRPSRESLRPASSPESSPSPRLQNRCAR